MKRDKRELLRIQSMIENDRNNMNDNFLDLVVSDLDKLLSDYFEYGGLPTIKIEKCGDRFKVQIEIYSSRIKSFDIVP